MLRLAQGRSEAAAAAIESALGSAVDRVSLALLLPAFAEIMLAVGRPDDGRAAADELAELAELGPSGMLGALANQTEGALLLACGEPRAALGPLRVALGAWQELDARLRGGTGSDVDRRHLSPTERWRSRRAGM